MQPGLDKLLAMVKNWKEMLKDARAEVTVRAAMAAQEDAIKAAVDKAAAGGKNKDAVLRQIEQRCIFAGVYSKGPLVAVVPNILWELSEAQKRAPKQGAFALRNGVYDDRHAAIRKQAYPYRPACSAKNGDPVLEVTCDGKVVGYLACHGDYFDDLSLLPAFHGCGIAKALICTAAKLSKSGNLSLDVRACNLPAIALYTKLGFDKSKNKYQPFYDWHGGYSMNAQAAEVAKQMPAGFDMSAL
jgi:ribosomal protein S18 acetylase RimI-like enzyme